MTKTETAGQQDEDLENMPELRYNQAQVAGTTTIHATTSANTSHVVV